MRNRQAGFTLIELLIVTTLLGGLALIALPNLQRSKERSYMATLQSDLRNLMVAQEVWFSTTGAYTDDVADLDFNSSPEVALELRTTGSDDGPGRGRGRAGDRGRGQGRDRAPGLDDPGDVESEGLGWSAQATWRDSSQRCAIYVGGVDPLEPAAQEGIIACEED